MQTDLQKYVEQGIESVEGWFNGDQIKFVLCADEFQKDLGIKGGVAEIGVHHGRSLILMMLCRRSGEKAVGIDVFDLQWMNWDQSGCGSREIFERNVLTHVGTMEDCAILQNDSLQITSSEVLALTGGQRIRLFSIDGSHTAHSTANDLAIAATCIAPGGIIFIDDYAHSAFPMVAEGVARFMLLSPRLTIAPVLAGANKVLFTTISHHEEYLQRFTSMKTSLPMIIREFYGRKCLCY